MTSQADFGPVPGVPMVLDADLTLVLAPNPSPMTQLGTNTYLLGQKSLAVIDPGPANSAHLAALLAAIDGRPVTHIIVTHSHLDHSPLARPLAQQTGAPIYAFGDSQAGRSAIMQELASGGLLAGGEGIDHQFAPDIALRDNDEIHGSDWTLQALHTPGHIGNHLCLRWRDAVFTGDHVMGWSTSLVSPPDGDLTDFMQSCRRLQDVPSKIFYPGHGGPVHEPLARLTWLISHRADREKQILNTISKTTHTLQSLTKAVYTDLQPALLSAAERNVLAHLIDLSVRGMASAEPVLGAKAKFRAILPQSHRVDRK